MADREMKPVLVPVRYSHNHGIDIILRVAFMPADHSQTPDIIRAGTEAEKSVRDEFIAEYGEEEIARDEQDYGGFEAHAFVEDTDEILGTDGNAYRIRIERADRPSMSKEELAARNKSGTACAACGGPLKGPYPGMLHCPECEG